MNIKNLSEDRPVSPNPWGSLEKTAEQNNEMPEILTEDDKPEDTLNGGDTIEADVDKMDFNHLDDVSEDPTENDDDEENEEQDESEIPEIEEEK
jgi:hypothetical protein